jgi:quinolinate synthetase A subunit
MNTIPSNLEEEILRLKREMNAVILAHYYQEDELQDIADVIGDSLELARKAAETSADVIVFCGVKFMAEGAKILNPSKQVLLPDLKAGCSASKIQLSHLMEFKPPLSAAAPGSSWPSPTSTARRRLRR